jgi:hypothetical protein
MLDTSIQTFLLPNEATRAISQAHADVRNLPVGHQALRLRGRRLQTRAAPRSPQRLKESQHAQGIQMDSTLTRVEPLTPGPA